MDVFDLNLDLLVTVNSNLNGFKLLLELLFYLLLKIKGAIVLYVMIIAKKEASSGLSSWRRIIPLIQMTKTSVNGTEDDAPQMIEEYEDNNDY